MPTIQHVHRRGAVYWWRRRLPVACPLRTCGKRHPRHVQASLGVREIGAARALAAHLTAWSEVVFERMKTGMLSASECNSVLQAEIKRLRARFGALSAIDIADGIRAQEARGDRIAAAGYALVASRGLKFDISPADRARLQSEGLAPAEIDQIQPLLAAYMQAGLLPPPPGKMARLLREQGHPDTEINRAQARNLYLRALSIALREQADIYETGFSDDSEHLALIASATVRDLSPPSQRHEPVLASVPPASAPPATLESSKTESTNPRQAAAMISLAAAGEKLIAEKKKFKRWNGKSAGQAEQTFHDCKARTARY